MFENDDDEAILTLIKVKPIALFHLYSIVIRYITEHHSIIEPSFHHSLERFEKMVTSGKETEQEYIEYCNRVKQTKTFVEKISLAYRDDRNIYFIADPNNKKSLIISINELPEGENLVKYMFNYNIERDRYNALKVKQVEAERKAKQAKDDEELIQAFKEQKAKEKKPTIQDLTRKANKKKTKEQQLRIKFEESAAEKELEKAKDKKKKQQKKSSSA
jgi:hypothetical protein